MICSLTSDVHLGSGTPLKKIIKILNEIKIWKPRIHFNLGDNNGGFLGYKATRNVVKAEREILGNEVILAELPGNHDYWARYASLPKKSKKYGDHPPPDVWRKCVEKVYEAYKEFNAFSLNQEPLRVDGWTFVGHTFWYDSIKPPETNDFHFLPINLDGDTHRTLYREAYNQFWLNLDQINEQDEKVVITTHFPLVGPRFQVAGGSTVYNGDRSSLVDALYERYKVKGFFNGHMHTKYLGPERFEAGSNIITWVGETPYYDYPRYLILDLTENGEIKVLHHVA
jgi:predicted phosphohydrolase